jgi:gamma-glutamyltranspeptidase/glutathione hydrolase
MPWSRQHWQAPYARNLAVADLWPTESKWRKGTLIREKAPRHSVFRRKGNVIWKSTKSALAIGVPGTIAGVLWYIKKLGSLPIEEI